MGEYLRNADQVLRAAGIPPDAPSTAELLKVLAERAHDWADSAAALGASIDPASATRAAAQALVADRSLLERLEQLEAGASEVMLRLQASVVEEHQRFASQKRPARRRRWGQDAQPCGSTAVQPFQQEVRSADADELGGLTASELLGLPAYDANGKIVGQIEAIVLAGTGGETVGIRLSHR